MIKKAYAKINLGLKVLGKRDDGFHDLEMVNSEINLSDILIVKKDNDIHVECCGVKEDDNLVYKVACYLKDKYKINSGVKIIIKKHIPMMAGLGGGSSDASTAIKMLSKFWGLNLGLEEMASIGLIFGSDIPFFIYGGASFVGGKGEIVKKLNPKKKIALLVVKPNVGFRTKDIYQNVSEYSDEGELAELINNLEDGELIKLSSNLVNDLEKAIDINNYRIIKDIKNDLKAYGAVNSLMSGSGSSVYGVFINKRERNRAFKSLRMFYNIYKAETIK